MRAGQGLERYFGHEFGHEAKSGSPGRRLKCERCSCVSARDLAAKPILEVQAQSAGADLTMPAPALPRGSVGDALRDSLQAAATAWHHTIARRRLQTPPGLLAPIRQRPPHVAARASGLRPPHGLRPMRGLRSADRLWPSDAMPPPQGRRPAHGLPPPHGLRTHCGLWPRPPPAASGGLGRPHILCI